MLELEDRPAGELVPQWEGAPQRRLLLDWIAVAPNAPYFVTEQGRSWTPVGHNDAITWPTLAGLFGRQDLSTVEAYLRRLTEDGVTCLRVMLEYAQVEHAYLERPLGAFVPEMVQLWDDLFALCEQHGIRLLVTPFDTFWTWQRWEHHPYNRRNGGPLDRPSRLLLCKETRVAIKERLSFATRRWGGSGVLFGWDLWNEIHPGQAEESADCFAEFIHDLSTHLRRLELELYGRSHPQTVSLFGPELLWRPEMPFKEAILRHPDLDFATIHVYHQGTIDDPEDTLSPALAMGRIVSETIEEIPAGRPFLDTEHGPIHRFKDHETTLPEEFDDECFRHTQWAHLAVGGAGGGMRWPNRHPHVLTDGMHRAQGALAGFLPLIDWTEFNRCSISPEVDRTEVSVLGCADTRQAVLWAIRTDRVSEDGRVDQAGPPLVCQVRVPGLAAGAYQIIGWNTRDGRKEWTRRGTASPTQQLQFYLELTSDIAIAVRPVS